jgi:Clostridium epsilon toxin ETX/Bacillus mosquitocidal toxin MTX2
MALQYLDTVTLQQYLVSAWENQLNTGEDPANGQWYTNGANGDSIGLYGGLTDVQEGLSFVFEDQSTTPTTTVFLSANVNNLNGLNPTANTINMSYAVQATLTTTHTETNTVDAGVSAEGGIDLVAEGKVTISASYEHIWQQSTTTTTTDITTFNYVQPITVPDGKVYQGQIVGTLYTVNVPYLAVIQVTGTSETWFNDMIQGHYNYSASAGDVFGWIATQAEKSSDLTGQSYVNNGNGQGSVTIPGTLTAQQGANFTGQVVDVTETAQQHIKNTLGRPLTEGDIAGLPALDGVPVTIEP